MQQNNLIKAHEDKYQSRIKVLETLASGASEETQVNAALLCSIDTVKLFWKFFDNEVRLIHYPLFHYNF